MSTGPKTVKRFCWYFRKTVASVLKVLPYKTLVHEATLRGNIRLVAVLPQTIEDSTKYLNTLGVPIEDVRQEQLTVEGTPTLIMVDSKGVVSEVWLGKLKPDKEAAVLSRHYRDSY
jgi:hypothetical protein